MPTLSIVKVIMNFCIQCETYLEANTITCPTCGAPQPASESITALWSTKLADPVTGSPEVAGDLLLVPTQEARLSAHQSALRAFNLTNGTQCWQRDFAYAFVSGLAPMSSAAIPAAPTTVLAALTSTDLVRGEGALLALDETGAESWRWAPDGVQRVSAPGLAQSIICVTIDGDRLITLDATTGQERNKFQLEANASLAAPTVAENVVYIPCQGPHLLAVGLDGRLRWRFDAEDSPHAWLDKSPVISEQQLMAVLNPGAVLALRCQDGSPLWQVDVGPGGKRLSPPATDGKRLYIGARDGLHALDLADGHEVWHFPTNRRIEAKPVLVDDTIYVTSHDHHLYGLKAATGQELWRYTVEHRLEVAPTFIPKLDSLKSCLIIADRGGTVMAVARPLTIEEYKAAGDWGKIAAAYAAQGQFAQGAELLETHGESFKAAQLWQKDGQLERAATQYEAAGVWLRAAQLWENLGRLFKRAEALARYAQSLANGTITDEEQAAAWEQAAQAYETDGESKRAAACWRKVAKHRQQPIVKLDIKHEGLVCDAWSRLQFIVYNQGYGSAYNLILQTAGDKFEGQVAATHQITTLRAGRKHTDWLDVCPRAYGKSVPLRVSISYQDSAQKIHTLTQTLYISVAPTESTRVPGQVDDLFEPSPHNTATIRKLLMSTLTDSEIRVMAFDEFRPAYEKMSSEMGKDKLVHILVEYCDTRLQVDRLLEVVKAINPTGFAKYAGHLKIT